MIQLLSKSLYFMGSLKLKSCAWAVFLNFSKIQGTTHIKERTNILRSYTYVYIFDLCKLFWEITDCHWIINRKNLFYGWYHEKYSFEHQECLLTCAKISRRTKISGGTNILRTLRYWFPTAFFGKLNIVFPWKVPKLVLRMGSWKLNFFT